MSSRFYFGASDDSTSDLSDQDNDSSSLPFPKPLARSAFLAPNFDATAFLSTLSNRFQTLEDLQTELRELSQSLNKELVDLVNDNYQDFLSLGSTLAGGEERIEDVRVGLLGFQRDLQGVRDQIQAKRDEVAALLAQKKALKQEMNAGRTLLEIAERLDELEIKLGLTQPGMSVGKRSKPSEDGGVETWSDVWHEDTTNDDSEEDYDEDESVVLSPRLRQRVEDFLIITFLMSKHSPQHPILVAEQSRIRRIRENLLLDIDAAIKGEPDVQMKQKMMQIRESVDE